MLRLIIFVALEFSVHQIEAYYKDYDTIINGSGEGVSVVFTKLIQAKIMDVPYVYCDVGVGSYVYCDPRVFEYVYTTAKIANQETYHYYFFLLKNEMFSLMFRPLIYWYYLGFDISDRFESFADNVIDYNNVYYPPFQSKRYYNMAGLCFNMDDSDLGWTSQHIIRFCHFVYVPFHNIEMKLFSESFSMHTTVELGLTVKCSLHKFEQSCWKTCQTVYERYTCDSNGNQICQNYYDNIDFIYQYEMPTFEYKYWLPEQNIWTKCILYNHCAFRMEAVYKKCALDYQCYPLGNDTFTCLMFRHTFIASKYSPILNVTFESIINDESVTVRIDLTGKDNELVKNHSFCQWKVDVWENKYYDINIVSNVSVLEFLPSAQHGNYSLVIECIIGRFRNFKMFPKYKLYISFNNVWLHNTSIGGNRTLFIGQIVRCFSDAITQSISRHHLMIDSLSDSYKLNKTFTTSIIIPLDCLLGIYMVTCRHTFIFPDARPQVYKFKSFYVEIRSFIYLYWWRKYKNVYTIHDLAGCRYLAYFLGSLSVRKNKGIGKLNIEPPNNFSTFTNTGGYYQFICTLTVTGDESMKFFKRIDFEIFYMPTKICILPLLPSPGSIIICSHNGYPADHATYYLSLKVNRRTLVSSKKNYIKLPYSIGIRKIAIWCSFKFFVQKKIETFNTHTEFVIQPEISKTMVFTDSDFSCLQNSGHQPANFEFLSDNKIFISSERLILIVLDPYLCEMWFGMFLMCILCTLGLIFYLMSDVKELKIDLTIHCIRSRSLNDQLKSLGKLAISGHFDKTLFFQFKLTNLSTTTYKIGTKTS